MDLYQQLSNINYSNNCYISGFRALNIADFDNQTGDWHRKVFWDKRSELKGTQILGKNSPTLSCDTNYYFGSEGIFEANDVLAKMGVPIFSEHIISANHARAIADLVLYMALQLKNPNLLIDSQGFDDFMELPSDKLKVYTILAKAMPKLKPNEQALIQNWLNSTNEAMYE